MGLNIFGALIDEHSGKEYIPTQERIRIGMQVTLPLIMFGIYINMFHLLDFILGFIGIDIAEDDGLPLWELAKRERTKSIEEEIKYLAESILSRKDIK